MSEYPNYERLRATFGETLDQLHEHSRACPDCDSSAILREPSLGLFVYTVLHDDSCPTFQRIQRIQRIQRRRDITNGKDDR